MTAVIKNELGTITMNEELIASIAGFAAGENYGIVAMNSKTAGDALLQLVGGENVKRGVKVSILEDQSIDIDLYVTLMYGVSLPAVAANTISNVKYRVEELTGLKVKHVNIYVGYKAFRLFTLEVIKID